MHIISKFIPQFPKGTVILSLISIISVVLGFARETTIAYFFGASAELDTFLVALTLPQFLAGQVGMITTAVVLPLYVVYKKAGNDEKASELLHRWFWLVAKIASVVCLVLALFAEPIVALMAPGLSDHSKTQAVQWLYWLLPYIWIMSSATCFKVVLDTNRKFAAPALAGAVISFAVIVACVTAAPIYGVAAMIPGFLVGSGFVFFMQWLKSRFFEPKLPSFHTQMSSFHRDKLPIADAGFMILVAATGQMHGIIDRGFASTLPEGSIAALNYANAINAVPSTVITFALGTAIFPVLASLAASNEWQKAYMTTRNWVRFLWFAGLLPIIILIVFRTDIISLLFQRGQFDAEATQMTASVLSFLPITIILSGNSVILNRLLLVQKQLLVMAGIATIAIVLKIIFNVIFITSFGLIGLVWATILTSFVTTVLRYFFTYKFTYKQRT